MIAYFTEDALPPNLQVQVDVASIIAPHMCVDGLVHKCLEYAESSLDHIMEFTRLRALNSLFAMINYNVRQVQSYNSMHSDFPMAVMNLVRFS
jgi:dynein heavy chain 1